jgi:hypothetical protein
MAHGYMREYDEDYRGDDRDRSEREWRNDDDRRWRERGRDRGMMFGDRDHDEDRGFFERLGDRARDAFRDDDEDHRHWGRDTGHGRPRGQREHRGAWENNRDWPGQDQPGSFGREHDHGQGQEGRRSFSSHPDDHYRSWRDRQVQALDRDYEDYCREREQQFHSDFDSWREQRGNPGPLRTGMTQTGLSADPSGETQAEAAANVGTTPPDPMDTATLGTTPRSRTKG